MRQGRVVVVGWCGVVDGIGGSLLTDAIGQVTSIEIMKNEDMIVSVIKEQRFLKQVRPTMRLFAPACAYADRGTWASMPYADRGSCPCMCLRVLC